jgi:two-component system, OmpR family, response regulator
VIAATRWPRGRPRPVVHEVPWFEAGPIGVCEAGRIIRLNGRIVRLTRAEMAVLMILIKAAGAAVSRDVVTRAAQRRPAPVHGNRLGDQTICTLRRKLGERGREPRLIVTVVGVGYAFEPTGVLTGHAAGGETGVPRAVLVS